VLAAVRHVGLLGRRQVAILLCCQTFSNPVAGLSGVQKILGRLGKPRHRDEGRDSRKYKQRFLQNPPHDELNKQTQRGASGCRPRDARALQGADVGRRRVPLEVNLCRFW
jgi:hypothetical protein